MFRSLLIATDLAPGSERLTGRAALLPLAQDARLTLLHVVPRSLPARARERAKRDAEKAIRAEAKSLARALPGQVQLKSLVKLGVAADEIAKRAAAVKAELIVMGRGSSRALRDLFIGSTAERVIRQARFPVLVVRLPPRSRYQRPALALDVDPAAHELLQLLLRVVSEPRPRVTVIHAFDVPYQGLVYSSLSQEEVEEYREHHQRRVARDLARLLDGALAEAQVSPLAAPSWKTHIRNGPARSVIEKAVKKANTDLLVLGTHGYSGVAHALLGSVAGDVLREVRCDVLVVPPR